MSGLLYISQISTDRITDLEAVLQSGQRLKCMMNARIALSTKILEPEPGDNMIKDPERVYEMAEEMARMYHKRQEVERRKREESAEDIVLGLGDALDDLGVRSGEEGSSGGEESDNLDSLLN